MLCLHDCNSCCKDKEPFQCVKFIHRLLTDICNKSGLKGLVYYGRPEKLCGCEEEIVCVTYNNGKDDVNPEPSCPSCLKHYSDVNTLLVSIKSHTIMARINKSHFFYSVHQELMIPQLVHLPPYLVRKAKKTTGMFRVCSGLPLSRSLTKFFHLAAPPTFS